MHTVDVLLPTYNPKREHLTEALQALQAQTYTNWQAFIHDDCSPNGETEDIVKPFLQDPRIRFKKSTKHLGIGGNWNACFRQTSAPIVSYLFQDDRWNEVYLESACDVLRTHKSVGFVSLEHEYRGEGGMTNVAQYQTLRQTRAETVKAGEHSGMEFLRTWIDRELAPNLVGEPDFVVLKRSVMENAGPFLEDMPQFLDTEYWLRLLTLTDWYNLRTKEYGFFRVHPNAASAMNEFLGHGLFDRLRCFDILVARLKGKDRRHVVHARNHAIQNMIGKFFDRVHGGKKTSTKGSGSLFSFCLRHPFVIGMALLRFAIKEVKIALRKEPTLR